MADLSAERTLVKSPPELWSELSELERLAKHLDAFGDIRITRLQPEREVAWEAERAAGTISMEPSGWGTRVTLTAALEDDGASVDEETGNEREPDRDTGDEGDDVLPTTRTMRMLDRLFPGWRAPSYGAPPAGALDDLRIEPEAPPAPPEPEPPHEQPDPPSSQPGPLDPERAREALDAVLDTLGSAHHRPFSRG
jgi:hypothetical protein